VALSHKVAPLSSGEGGCSSAAALSVRRQGLYEKVTGTPTTTFRLFVDGSEVPSTTDLEVGPTRS
jgi:hypothetical protein